jgi:hypothetical protein
MVTRGVLLDVARFKGVDHLERGYIITAEDLEKTAAQQGGTVQRVRAHLNHARQRLNRPHELEAQAAVESGNALNTVEHGLV